MTVTTDDGLTHILDADQFSADWLLGELFPRADLMRQIHHLGDSRLLTGRRLFSLFYQPSTRTRISFESAMTSLGGTVSGIEVLRENRDRDDEPLEDRVRVLCSYGYDVLLVRYHEEGGAARAASVSTAPVINAGDGEGQHPTQALLDAYTIHQELGRLAEIEVALVGDLTYERSVNSLAELLAKFPAVRLRFVSPSTLRIRPAVRDRLIASGANFDETDDLDAVVPSADVIYLTRAHSDRMAMAQRFEPATRSYAIDEGVLARMKDNAIVLHPLPRGPELALGLEADRRVACFRQAENGLYVRMALLTLLLQPGSGGLNLPEGRR
ncbi:MAG: aspartate carbamoyltransferase [Chloroflexi bacterium]|nr:aspartate carbamoyltransferase [Chloroflexota bacterium]